MKPQTKQVLRYLEKHASITPMDAIRELGCMRLAARVRELKQAGYDVRSTTVRMAGGKTFAKYELA